MLCFLCALQRERVTAVWGRDAVCCSITRSRSLIDVSGRRQTLADGGDEWRLSELSLHSAEMDPTVSENAPCAATASHYSLLLEEEMQRAWLVRSHSEPRVAARSSSECGVVCAHCDHDCEKLFADWSALAGRTHSPRRSRSPHSYLSHSNTLQRPSKKAHATSLKTCNCKGTSHIEDNNSSVLVRSESQNNGGLVFVDDQEDGSDSEGIVSGFTEAVPQGFSRKKSLFLAAEESPEASSSIPEEVNLVDLEVSDPSDDSEAAVRTFLAAHSPSREALLLKHREERSPAFARFGESSSLDGTERRDGLTAARDNDDEVLSPLRLSFAALSFEEAANSESANFDHLCRQTISYANEMRLLTGSQEETEAFAGTWATVTRDANGNVNSDLSRKRMASDSSSETFLDSSNARFDETPSTSSHNVSPAASSASLESSDVNESKNPILASRISQSEKTKSQERLARERIYEKAKEGVSERPADKDERDSQRKLKPKVPQVAEYRRFGTAPGAFRSGPSRSIRVHGVPSFDEALSQRGLRSAISNLYGMLIDAESFAHDEQLLEVTVVDGEPTEIQMRATNDSSESSSQDDRNRRSFVSQGSERCSMQRRRPRGPSSSEPSVTNIPYIPETLDSGHAWSFVAGENEMTATGPEEHQRLDASDVDALNEEARPKSADSGRKSVSWSGQLRSMRTSPAVVEQCYTDGVKEASRIEGWHAATHQERQIVPVFAASNKRKPSVSGIAQMYRHLRKLVLERERTEIQLRQASDREHLHLLSPSSLHYQQKFVQKLVQSKADLDVKIDSFWTTLTKSGAAQFLTQSQNHWLHSAPSSLQLRIQSHYAAKGSKIGENRRSTFLHIEMPLSASYFRHLASVRSAIIRDSSAFEPTGTAVAIATPSRSLPSCCHCLIAHAEFSFFSTLLHDSLHRHLGRSSTFPSAYAIGWNPACCKTTL